MNTGVNVKDTRVCKNRRKEESDSPVSTNSKSPHVYKAGHILELKQHLLQYSTRGEAFAHRTRLTNLSQIKCEMRTFFISPPLPHLLPLLAADLMSEKYACVTFVL